LFHKLWEKGVRGKMFRVLYNLYQGATRVASHDGCVTDAFSSDVGLHEGDVISPTLYLFFIDDLLKEVWSKHPGVNLLGPCDNGAPSKAVAAMQADDFVAVCSSLEETQAVANTVLDYSNMWRFRLNSKKSAVMHVPPPRVSSNLTESGIVWNGVPVPVVTKYCYLGLWFQNNCSWNTHFEATMQKVGRRVAMLMPVWKNRHITVPVKRIVMLTCVRPIIEHGAEVWWPTKQQMARIDRIQTNIIKCAMRISKEKPCSHAILAEWGVKPLHMWLHQRAIEYYYRVQRMQADRLPRQVFEAEWRRDGDTTCVLPWQRYVGGLLCKYGIDEQTARSGKAACKTHVKKQQAACYSDLVAMDTPKLRSLQRYLQHVHPTHVNDMSFDVVRPYLCVERPTLGIELMMRIRLGCLCVHEHALKFSRHANHGDDADHSVDAVAALCPACGTAEETISHFVFECPKTADLRNAMINDINNSFPDAWQKCQGMVDQQKALSFVSCGFWGGDEAMAYLAPLIARYLEKAWRVRNKCKHGHSTSSVSGSAQQALGAGPMAALLWHEG